MQQTQLNSKYEMWGMAACWNSKHMIMAFVKLAAQWSRRRTIWWWYWLRKNFFITVQFHALRGTWNKKGPGTKIWKLLLLSKVWFISYQHERSKLRDNFSKMWVAARLVLLNLKFAFGCSFKIDTTNIEPSTISWILEWIIVNNSRM